MKALKGIIYTSSVLLLLSPVYLLLAQQRTPERHFLGKWKEAAWEYKEADRYMFNQLADQQNKQATAAEDHIRVHTGETWYFKPNGVLELRQDNARTKQMKWSLKGRGNVLEITDGTYTEHYDVSTMNPEKIELNYLSDAHVKESAKLIFEKT